MLTVAVTGATGEVGRPFVAALEREPAVGRILALGRRAFDPAEEGWAKVEYRRGDVLDRGAVAALVDGADVVAHLAFVIVADQGHSREVNLIGSRNVFEAAASAGAARLVYTSSVAAYGFHEDAPARLHEDLPPRGTERHPYSAQKSEVEEALAESLAGTETGAYVFRPCIVAGPRAPAMLEAIPLRGQLAKLPGLGLLGRIPGLKPVLPDPGVSFQLVHHDDVAAALATAVLGEAPTGIYNLAGPGEITVSVIARELGWHAVPVPSAAVSVTAAAVARLPFLPPEAAWIEAVRRPVLMDTGRARRELGWRPRCDAAETLRQTIAAWRQK
ncbi:MAG TPA: NAD-dependent epimerase/dehydratase family protein [Solirubrobacterales bacterium]|nr:NAD-dependent epimerase/dehydratase family protein [Solirubrobacterales bacterium]